MEIILVSGFIWFLRSRKADHYLLILSARYTSRRARRVWSYVTLQARSNTCTRKVGSHFLNIFWQSATFPLPLVIRYWMWNIWSSGNRNRSQGPETSKHPMFQWRSGDLSCYYSVWFFINEMLTWHSHYAVCDNDIRLILLIAASNKNFDMAKSKPCR